MPRFHLPPDQCRGETLTLTGGEAHHARRVLRLRPGNRVTVLDGDGTTFLCDVRGTNRSTVELRILEKTRVPPLPCQITLLQAIPKGKLIEDIIEKATELGACRIVPLLSDRVVMRLDANNAAEKTARWQHVAIEAIKQCGAAWLPRVETPVTPAQFLARNESFDLSLLAALQGDRRPAREHFQDFRAQHARLPATIAIWIGPEGDFTPAEVDAIRAAGVRPITLGPLVLRCETAALYCLSIVSHELLTENRTR